MDYYLHHIDHLEKEVEKLSDELRVEKRAMELMETQLMRYAPLRLEQGYPSASYFREKARNEV